MATRCVGCGNYKDEGACGACGQSPYSPMQFVYGTMSGNGMVGLGFGILFSSEMVIAMFGPFVVGFATVQ